MRHYLASSAGLCHADSLTSELCDELTGSLLSRFSLSCLQKISGLSRTPQHFPRLLSSPAMFKYTDKQQ